MGKRAKKSKKSVDDSSVLSDVITNGTHKVAKKNREQGKRSRQESRLKRKNGVHSNQHPSLLAGSTIVRQNSCGEEDEDVDVDTIGSDDPASHDLFPIQTVDKSSGPEGPDDLDTEPHCHDSVYNSLSLGDIDVIGNELVQVDGHLYPGQTESGGDALVPCMSAQPAGTFAIGSLVSHDPLGATGLQNNNNLGVPGSAGSINFGDCSNLVPSSMMGVAPGLMSTTTAFAQVSSIEPGPNGKGYVLHLNIPALGLANVVLSTPGLSLAPGMDAKMLNLGMLPTANNELSPPTDGLSDEGVDNPSFEDSPHFQELDDVAEHSPESSSLGSYSPDGTGLLCTADMDDVEHDVENGDCDSNLVEIDNMAILEGSSSSSSDSGCGLGSELDASSGSSLLESDAATTESLISGLVNVAQWVEKPEVDRFVICSDGPMECVLCSFRTLEYSSFKSHIICSHPCWRITKKLSKNRLLVEKSVKMNVNLSPQTPSNDGRKSRRNGSGPRDKDTKAETKNSGKSKKTLQVHQRKKQMLERNKRLFRCSVCMRLFVFEGSIVNHLVDHHLVKKPYDHIQVSNNHGTSFGKIHRCSHKNCYTSCVTEEELERHRLESHGQVVYRCQICGYTADSADAVEKHASTIHNQYDLMYGLVD